MAVKYSVELKNKIVNLIVNNKESTSKTAEKYNIPLKTVEKWITAYNHGEYFSEYNNRPRRYENSFKKRLAELVVLEKESTSGTAVKYNIPLKTLEKWVTLCRKDNNCFD